MPKYVIERDIKDVGNTPPEQVVAISQKSCSALQNLGPRIQWLHSYVTKDKIYCVYTLPTRKWSTNMTDKGASPPIASLK